jgi:hypothetical protein
MHTLRSLSPSGLTLIDQKARQLLLMTFLCSEGVWIKPHPRELTVLWLLDVNRGRNWVPGVSPA